MKNIFSQYPRTSLFLLFYGVLMVIFIFTGRSFWYGFQGYYDEVVQYNKMQFIHQLIDKEKDKRIALELFKGKSEKEAQEYVQSLESQFQKEQEKFFHYCSKNSKNCKVTSKISCFSCSLIDYFIFNGAYRTIRIDYTFDTDSCYFFNEIKEVGNDVSLYPRIKDQNDLIFKWNLIGYSSELGDFIRPTCKHCGPVDPIYQIDKSQTIDSASIAIIQRNSYSHKYSIQLKGK